MARLYAYIVARDNGFAPNPFHGFCTLACCMPVTRRVARVGDYIVGLGTKSRGNRLVYAMQISKAVTFDEYWSDSHFLAKRPDMSAGGEKALGDNIYRWDAAKNEWEKAWSHHSRDNAAEDQRLTNDDTRTNRVLIGKVFTYWGGEGPPVPDSLTFRGQPLPSAFEHGARGHRVNFWDEEVAAFIKWFNDLGEREERCRLGTPTAMLEADGKGKGKQRKGC